MEDLKAAMRSVTDEFEVAWESLLSTSMVDNSFSEYTGIAARRLASYNPQNVVLQEKTNFSERIESICNIIREKSKIIEANPMDVEAWKMIFFSYLILDDYANAYTAAARCLKLIKPAKRDPWFAYCAGVIFSHFGFDEKAMNLFREAHIRISSKQNPDLYFRMALIIRRNGIIDEALTILKNLQQSPPPGLTSNDISIQIAYTFQCGGNLDEAIPIYEKLMRENYKVDLIKHQYVWALSLHSELSSYQRVKELFQRPENSNDSFIKFAMARLAMKWNNIEEAFKYYKECTADWSDCVLFWGGLGVLYMKSNQEEDALVAFQRALYLRQDTPEVLFNIGLIHEARENLLVARQMYQGAQRIWQDSKRVAERLQNLGTGFRGKTLRQYILELETNKYFDEPIEELSTELLNTPVDLSSYPLINAYGLQDKEWLFPPFKSIFK